MVAWTMGEKKKVFVQQQLVGGGDAGRRREVGRKKAHKTKKEKKFSFLRALFVPGEAFGIINLNENYCN